MTRVLRGPSTQLGQNVAAQKNPQRVCASGDVLRGRVLLRLCTARAPRCMCVAAAGNRVRGHEQGQGVS